MTRRAARTFVEPVPPGGDAPMTDEERAEIERRERTGEAAL